jgi:hypothetical protein
MLTFWEYGASFRCCNFRLLVYSNAPGSLVRELGKGILGVVVCGK